MGAGSGKHCPACTKGNREDRGIKANRKEYYRYSRHDEFDGGTRESYQNFAADILDNSANSETTKEGVDETSWSPGKGAGGDYQPSSSMHCASKLLDSSTSADDGDDVRIRIQVGNETSRSSKTEESIAESNSKSSMQNSSREPPLAPILKRKTYGIGKVDDAERTPLLHQDEEPTRTENTEHILAAENSEIVQEEQITPDDKMQDNDYQSCKVTTTLAVPDVLAEVTQVTCPIQVTVEDHSTEQVGDSDDQLILNNDDHLIRESLESSGYHSGDPTQTSQTNTLLPPPRKEFELLMRDSRPPPANAEESYEATGLRSVNESGDSVSEHSEISSKTASAIKEDDTIFSYHTAEQHSEQLPDSGSESLAAEAGDTECDCELGTRSQTGLKEVASKESLSDTGQKKSETVLATESNYKSRTETNCNIETVADIHQEDVIESIFELNSTGHSVNDSLLENIMNNNIPLATMETLSPGARSTMNITLQGDNVSVTTGQEKRPTEITDCVGNVQGDNIGIGGPKNTSETKADGSLKLVVEDNSVVPGDDPAPSTDHCDHASGLMTESHQIEDVKATVDSPTDEQANESIFYNAREEQPNINESDT